MNLRLENLKRNELMGQLVVQEVMKNFEELEKKMDNLSERLIKIEQSKKHEQNIVLKKVTRL